VAERGVAGAEEGMILEALTPDGKKPRHNAKALITHMDTDRFLHWVVG